MKNRRARALGARLDRPQPILARVAVRREPVLLENQIIGVGRRTRAHLPEFVNRSAVQYDAHLLGTDLKEQPGRCAGAEAILAKLASAYSNHIVGTPGAFHHFFKRLDASPITDAQIPNLEAKYRALVEQLPAAVFIAYLDRGIGEAYVSPQIEATLGFSQADKVIQRILRHSNLSTTQTYYIKSPAHDVMLGMEKLEQNIAEKLEGQNLRDSDTKSGFWRNAGILTLAYLKGSGWSRRSDLNR